MEWLKAILEKAVMLYTNEYNALVEAVQDLSGMDDDFDDLKNDAKNE